MTRLDDEEFIAAYFGITGIPRRYFSNLYHNVYASNNSGNMWSCMEQILLFSVSDEYVGVGF